MRIIFVQTVTDLTVHRKISTQPNLQSMHTFESKRCPTPRDVRIYIYICKCKCSSNTVRVVRRLTVLLYHFPLEVYRKLSVCILAGFRCMVSFQPNTAVVQCKSISSAVGRMVPLRTTPEEGKIRESCSLQLEHYCLYALTFWTGLCRAFLSYHSFRLEIP